MDTGRLIDRILHGDRQACARLVARHQDGIFAFLRPRRFGAVPLADVVGRVRQVWFSRGDGAIRWSRIGELVN